MAKKKHLTKNIHFPLHIPPPQEAPLERIEPLHNFDAYGTWGWERQDIVGFCNSFFLFTFTCHNMCVCVKMFWWDPPKKKLLNPKNIETSTACSARARMGSAHAAWTWTAWAGFSWLADGAGASTRNSFIMASTEGPDSTNPLRDFFYAAEKRGWNCGDSRFNAVQKHGPTQSSQAMTIVPTQQ